MSDKITEKLERIIEKDEGKPRKKIAILGAGMAGLAAAYELNKLGHEVIVYEASCRVGGRAWTHRFDDGQYHELGAMRFPASHDHTRYYAKTVCKLSFRKFVNHHEDEDAFYFVKNKLSFHKDYDIKLLPELGLTEGEKELIENGPIEVKSLKLLNLFVGPLVALVKRTIAVESDVKALFREGPMTPQIAALERVSLGDFVRSHLESQDAIDLVGAITGLEVWWDKAITMILRDEIVGTGEGLEEIVGGTSLLPDTMTVLLEKSGVTIHYHHEITSINNRQKDVQIAIRNRKIAGKPVELLDCDFVVCTIPFAVLRRIKLTGVSEGKMRAIRNLTYASSTKVLLDCKERFWEAGENAIIGGGSQTDLINRSIYYPSDNYEEKLQSKKVMSFSKGLFTAFDIGEKSVKDQDVCKGPGVIVGSYNWGADARRLGGLSKRKRTEVVVSNLSNIHPELSDSGMVVDSASVFWDEMEWAGGAFCFMQPGDFIHYYDDAIRPEGRLFFAGEHCSLDQGWIQGALIASVRAVEAIVEH